MRRRRVAVSVAVLAALTGAAGMAHAQAIPVTVGGAASSVVGTPFDLPVVIDMRQRADKLGSFALTLRWNPSVLQLVAGVDGQMGALTTNDDSMPQGVVKFTAANPAGLGGLITVALGRFKPLVTDTTTFRVSVSELYAAGTFADLLPSVASVNRGYCPARGRYGDVAGSSGPPDGVIDSKDALVALMSAVGLNVSSFDIGLADVDASGAVDPRDALLILSYAVGLDVSAFRLNVLAPGSACAAAGGAAFALTPGAVTILAGQQVQYLALGTDSTGAAIGTPNVSWTSSAAGVATVDSLGHVVGVASGSALITARRDSTVMGTANVTVVASRKVHWVDALAAHSMNQLGTTGLPFGTIQQAINFAGAGDTVRVRSGRYPEADSIAKRLVIQGDTSGGGSRPVIAGNLGYGLTLTGGPRVDVRDVVFDTLYQAITATGVDTLRVRNVDIRSASSAAFGVYADSIGALRIEQSRFLGRGRLYSYSDDAVYVGRAAGLVVIDSTRISDYGYDAVYVNQADSMLVRGSWIHDNSGYGVDLEAPDSSRGSHAGFVRNRFSQNAYGHVYVDIYAAAHFDHNVLSGTGYGGITLYGYSQSRATLHGDSITSNNGEWISAYNGDSLFADSLAVRGSGYYYGYLDYIRAAVVRDSRFANVTDYAIEASGTSTDTMRLVLRNVAFDGGDPSVCKQCGEGVDGYYVNLDADSVTSQNLDYVVYNDYGNAALGHVTSTYDYEVAENDCGSMVVNNVTVTGSYYGVQGYGCAPADSLVVNQLASSGSWYGVYASSVRSVVQNSSFDSAQYAVYSYDGPVTVQNVQVTNPTYRAFYLYSYGLGSETVSGSSVTCDAAGSTSVSAFQMGGSGTDSLVAKNNTITNCQYGIGMYNGAYNEIRGNTITLSSSGTTGAEAYADTTTVIVGNTVTGPATAGAIWGSYGNAAVPGTLVRVDSNVVINPSRLGIGVNGAKTLLVRDNRIDSLRAGSCCFNTRIAGIVLLSQASDAQSASVLRNRITGSVGSGIVLTRATGDTVTILVDSNTVKGADSVGIWVDNYATARLRKNAIDSTGLDAVRVSNTNRGVPPLLAQNNFTRSKGYGLNNATANTVTATNNWWGDAKGPSGSLGDQTSTGDSVSTLVTFNPWLSLKASTLTPAPVWLASPLVRAMPARPTATASRLGASARVSRAEPRARRAPPHAQAVEPTVSRSPSRPRSPSGAPVPATVRDADARHLTDLAARQQALAQHVAERAARRTALERRREAEDAARAQRVQATAARGATKGGDTP